MLRMIYALVFVLLISTPSIGQQSLVGTYKYVSHVAEIDGLPTEPLGKAPRGYLMFTPTRVIAVVTAETRKPGTSVAEKAALLDTLSAWSGRYRIEGNRIIFSPEVSWVETWNGKDLFRTWQLSGNRLTLTGNPEPSPRQGGKMSILRQVWEKIE
jgi:hypothetical protein